MRDNDINENMEEQAAELTMAIPGLAMSRKDMKVAANLTGNEEARFLVGRYYSVQKQRIAAGNMVRSLEKDGKPCDLSRLLFYSHKQIEDDIKVGLDVFVHNHIAGDWLLDVHGIGVILAAGLMTHIEIEKAPTVGHIWNFAGLNPTLVWKKGQKRPHNAELKTLCYKCGESFVKTSNSDKAFYGHVYKERKAKEVERNERGEFAEQAANLLATRNIQSAELKKHYEAGRLSPGHIDMRARRKAIKLFLSHLHEVWFYLHTGQRAPRPYAIEHLGHAHYIEVPNAPWD